VKYTRLEYRGRKRGRGRMRKRKGNRQGKKRGRRRKRLTSSAEKESISFIVLPLGPGWLRTVFH